MTLMSVEELNRLAGATLAARRVRVMSLTTESVRMIRVAVRKGRQMDDVATIFGLTGPIVHQLCTWHHGRLRSDVT